LVLTAACIGAAAVAALLVVPLGHRAHGARRIREAAAARPVERVPIPVPPNDAFSHAKAVDPTARYRGNLEGATAELGEPDHGGAPARHSVWFKYRATRGGRITVDTYGSKVNTTLGVYTGRSIADLRLLRENDDSYERQASPGSSAFHFGTQRGQTYYIVVEAPYGMCRSCAPAVRGDYTVSFSDGSTAGKRVWLSVKRGQTVASVRSDGLDVIVGTRRALWAAIELVLSRRTADKLDLANRVIAHTRGGIHYKEQLPATLILSSAARRALAHRAALVGTVRLTLLGEAFAPHRVLRVPLRLPS
jgi:hypothetical protein